MHELSPDQNTCLDQIMSWWTDSKESLYTLGGFAGTGKSYLISVLRTKLENIKVAFCCYTGKATSVLNNKLKHNNSLRSSDKCSTIHSLIYTPDVDKNGDVIGWKLRDNLDDYDLLILDEASMVSEDVFCDLESFGIPILAVGDHGQLPPVGGNLNLMKDPQSKLEKIHRQNENNPIIEVSYLARTEGFIPYGTYGKTVVKCYSNNPLVGQFLKYSKDFNDTAILCGFNKTRVKINKQIRAMKGYTTDLPWDGERLICLKNNKNSKMCPIYNGVQGTVMESRDMGQFLKMSIKIDGESSIYTGPVSPNSFDNSQPELDKFKVKWMTTDENNHVKFETRFPDYFDYGYCLSVHKSQGSEWRRVMVIEEPCKYWSGPDWNRWLYTAVTRATEQLLIIR